MKVLILADAQSAHTVRWARGLVAEGLTLEIVSFRPAKIDNIPIHVLNSPKISSISPSTSFLSRFHYLFGKRATQKIVDRFDPDIVHAFWATSYGFLGARLQSRRFLVSVWGMDITDSPKNMIMATIVRFVLRRAQIIFCTSVFLKTVTEHYVSDKTKLKHIPFGVDTNLFFKARMDKKDSSVIIGSTKSFEPKYGILNLVKVFSRLARELPHLKLLLVGSGSLEKKIIALIAEYQLKDRVVIKSQVSISEVPIFLNKMDIFVMPSVSDSETFGVAAIEAAACELPVIASDIGGIPEVIRNGITGFLVPPGDESALYAVMKQLVLDESLRVSMGKAGRKFVSEKYQWAGNVQSLVRAYDQL